MRIAFGVWFVIATLQADPDGNQSVWVPLWIISLTVLLWFSFQDWKDTRKEKAEGRSDRDGTKSADRLDQRSAEPPSPPLAEKGK